MVIKWTVKNPNFVELIFTTVLYPPVEIYSKVRFCDISKTMLLYDWKSCRNCPSEVDPKAEEVDPEGSKVNPPSNLLSLSLERFLLVFFTDNPPLRPDGTACQEEGATVSEGGNKDGVQDEEEKGERAGA